MPTKKKHEHGTEIGDRVLKSTDCGPPSGQATRWGAWNTNEDAAVDSAYANARRAAARACRGDCSPRSLTCAYTEREAELLDEETRVNDRGDTEFRFRARSQGGCACE